MNCHFPQNDLASAESKYIAATDLQYIVPTDGSPLRGLIQDHVDSGVKMTCKDTFLEKWEYQQLIFAALASLPGLEVIRSDADIELLPQRFLNLGSFGLANKLLALFCSTSVRAMIETISDQGPVNCQEFPLSLKPRHLNLDLAPRSKSTL
jgi:hypothetical protein